MTTFPRLAKRVLLVGLEGVDWSALQAAIQSEGLPTLAALLRSGVSGSLATPAPRIESPLWTSLITGKRAHKHGVLHAQQQAEHDRGACPVLRPTIRTATLGAILSASELTVHQVGWPVSHPVEQLSGVAVSNRFATDGSIESLGQSGGWPWITPAAAAAEIFARRSAPDDIEEVALAQFVPATLITQPTLGHLQRISRLVMAESLTVFRVTKWCMSRAEWDGTLCAFPTIDRLSNALASTLSPSELERFGPGILAACYEYLDMLLGQLVAAAGDDATIMVIGMDSASSPQPRLILRSPTIQAGATLPPSASVLDVTPTLLTLLGIPVGQDMDGQVWENLIAQRGSSANAPELVETWDTCVHSPTEKPTAPTKPPIDESVQYLLELGYADPLETRARQLAEQCRRETRRNRALSLLDAGLYDEAIDELQNLKSEFPDWTSPYELLAETYLQLRQNELAENEIEFLVHHGAESARLYFALGRLSVTKREINQALTHYHVAERITANLRGLQLARGLALLKQHNYQNAQLAFQQALRNDGQSAPILDGLATCYLGLQEHEQAAEFALAAVDQDPHFAPAHYHLALALIGIGRMAEAKQAFELGLASEPEFVAALRRLAWLCQEQLAEPEQAEAYRHRGREIIRRRRQARQAGNA